MKSSLLIISALILVKTTFAQPITGNWEGKLDAAGTSLPIIFHISTDSTGKFSATFDSPNQQAFNLPCSGVIANNDSLVLLMNMIKGRYAGKLSTDKKQLTGTLSQGASSFPLDMRKTSDVTMVKEQKRPQTPGPPYPYRSEDVEYDNADKSVHFGGTFTVPLPEPGVNYFRKPIYPVVLLITGSGKQDRDETILGHKPFAIIADYLTRHGIAVLRVDDRDMGKTTGNFSIATTADFAKDVEAGVNYLKTRNDVDVSNIGLLGHSEGGMIAPMVASERADVKFIVLLAGPGIRIIQLMEQQSIDVAAAAGISREELEQYRPLYRNLVNTIIAENDTAKTKQKAILVFKNWQKDKSASVVKNTTGVASEKSLDAYITAFIRQLSQPWFHYFIEIDPSYYLARIKCPVLALNGEKDIQVSAKPNLAGIKAALEKAGNHNFKAAELPGLNHLFQHCKKCSLDEYGELEESFSPGALEIITTWIKGIAQ